MEEYNMVAFCTEQTSAEQEYFYSINPMGVNACVVNLTIGQNEQNLLAEKQIKAAKNAGMVIHVSHIARFSTPEEARNEAKFFLTHSRAFNLSEQAIHTLIFTPTVADKTAVELINFFQEILYLNGYRNQDLCVSAQLIANNIIGVGGLHLRPNLTVIDYNRLYPSVAGAGSWIFDNEYLDERQLIAYDFMDFYTKANQLRGRQLSLDSEYVARTGDNYWMIAQQLGIKLTRLLLLNNAKLDDKVVPGQRIKIA
ncbi:GH25 family lysozyme [Limosilactobacillus rudii]|uniref:GH25 family lysozyme n=1 Tax=Limosilactobacillus rudii TaxID=2759755 RepID=UPI0015F7E869|nr:GH25 family lysozyme [Limosilactobacillus rudii]MBB1078308.1 LysM peptidoglycan-binding domain-containing protein [Limosilactobacillus rudii]